MTEIILHRFKTGNSAKLTLSDSPPSMACEWEQPPTRRVIPEYLLWRNRSIAAFATKSGQRIMVVDVP